MHRNLQADVDRWKKRARYWQAESEQWQQKYRHQQQCNNDNNPLPQQPPDERRRNKDGRQPELRYHNEHCKGKAAKDDDENYETGRNNQKQPTKPLVDSIENQNVSEETSITHTAPVQHDTIPDSMFELDSSSEEDDHENKHHNENDQSPTKNVVDVDDGENKAKLPQNAEEPTIPDSMFEFESDASSSSSSDAEGNEDGKTNHDSGRVHENKDSIMEEKNYVDKKKRSTLTHKQKRKRQSVTQNNTFAFDLSSSSSSSSSSQEDDENDDWYQTHIVGGIHEENDNHFESKNRPFIAKLLVEAYTSLKTLGIPLVSTSSDNDMENRDDAATSPSHLNASTVNQEVNATHEEARVDGMPESVQECDAVVSPPSVVITRLSDEEVIESLFSVIRDTTRQELLDPEFQQFECSDVARNQKTLVNPKSIIDWEATDADKDSLINDSTTAVRGGAAAVLASKENANAEISPESSPAKVTKPKEMLFRALLILDGFCSADDDFNDGGIDDQWDLYFTEPYCGKVIGNLDESESILEEMRIGLKDRKKMVALLIKSLSHDIQEAWARQDAVSYRTQTSLHYHESSENITDENDADEIIPSLHQARLSFQLERHWIAQLVIGLCLARHDRDAAANVVMEYFLSSIGANDSKDDDLYGCLPPILSMVVLEGLLLPDPRLDSFGCANEHECDNKDSRNLSAWFEEHLSTAWGGDQTETIEAGELVLLPLLAHCVQETVAINKVRAQSSGERIRLLARLELSSFERLKARIPWLDNPDSQLLLHFDKMIEGGSLSQKRGRSTQNSVHALQVALIRKRSLHAALQLMRQCLAEDTDHYVAVAAAKSYRQLAVRQMNEYRDSIGGAVRQSILCLGQFDTVVKRLNNIQNSDPWELVVAILECASILGDAMPIICTIDNLASREMIISKAASGNLRRFMETMSNVCNQPTLRVINLQRRADRMNAFIAQAIADNVLTVLAVAFINPAGETQIPESGQFFGLHALDGSGRMAQVREVFLKAVGGKKKSLDALIQPQWRPNDLKPFDRDAPKSDHLVMMTDTEIACALSHIASWKGVLRSLDLPATGSSSLEPGNRIFRHEHHVRRLVRISGFAHGEPLDAKLGDLPPTPVCVILEDDAILCARFRDRLDKLLKELPRDFHFCSIGYSRPKSAPILPFTSQVGIPSHLFYMTGYILSAAGAQFLINSLPVVGPVDSWIGLKMTNNWDNVYGEALGVGVHSRPHCDTPPARKDLKKILQFQAYCARQPLCWQRVDGSSKSGDPFSQYDDEEVTGRLATPSWRRQRDTDIVYSGGQNKHRMVGTSHVYHFLRDQNDKLTF